MWVSPRSGAWDSTNQLIIKLSLRPLSGSLTPIHTLILVTLTTLMWLQWYLDVPRVTSMCEQPRGKVKTPGERINAFSNKAASPTDFVLLDTLRQQLPKFLCHTSFRSQKNKFNPHPTSSNCIFINRFSNTGETRNKRNYVYWNNMTKNGNCKF